MIFLYDLNEKDSGLELNYYKRRIIDSKGGRIRDIINNLIYSILK